jgi:hypothetical protein
MPAGAALLDRHPPHFQTAAHRPNPILRNFSKKDYRESLLDGLCVLHNPHATWPPPLAYFNHEDITQGTLLRDNPVSLDIIRS